MIQQVWNPRRPLLKSHQFGGRLAQLGERIVRNDEAGGSNPLPSTKILVRVVKSPNRILNSVPVQLFEWENLSDPRRHCAFFSWSYWRDYHFLRVAER